MSRAGSAGLPALNVETRLLDDDEEEVGPGEIGEIVHRSPQATLGYWNDEAKTAEAFRDGWSIRAISGASTQTDTCSSSTGRRTWSRRRRERREQRGRGDDLPLERGLGGGRIGRPDPRWIEAVVAAVVPKSSASLTPEAVVAHCRSRLAGFKTPRHVVVVESLPKNPSGKLLKRDLRERYAELAHTPDAAPRA